MFKTVVIEELIPPESQDIIQYELEKNAEWRFVDDVSGAQSDYPSYGFVHVMKHPNYGIISPMYAMVATKVFDAAVNKLSLDVKDIHYTRAFLQLPLSRPYLKNHNGIHVDLPIPHIVCVYYVNDSDGDTIIYENTFGTDKTATMVPHMRVTPKKGKAVLFDGMRYHCSSQPTTKHRCIVNLDMV